MSNDPSVIAVIPVLFPIPPEAGTPRAYHLLKRLGERAPVHLAAAVSDGPAAWEAFVRRPELAGIFASVQVRHVRAHSGSLAQAATFLSGRPPFDLRFKDPDACREMRGLVSDLVERHGPAVFYCLGINALEFVPRKWWSCCVVDSTDAQSLMLERTIRSGTHLSPLRRLKLFLAQPSLRRYEKRMFREVGAAVYNSSTDIAWIRRRHPEAPIVRVIDGCDTDYFSPSHFPGLEESPDEILFMGHMGYPPNVDAAVHLATAIMPRIWRRRPGVRALLIGPEPPERLRRLHDGERILVVGGVPDVRPYVMQAAVVVSAVRFGAGMKNKLQSSLAMEKAVVATTVTCEGFDELRSGQHAIVADDPQQFADAVCDLLEDPQRRVELGRRGARLIRQGYTWEAAVRELWRAVQECPRAEAGAPLVQAPHGCANEARGA